MSRERLKALGIVLLYGILRLGFDSYWRQWPLHFSYIFETLFVLSVGYIYRSRIRWNVSLRDLFLTFSVAVPLGFGVYKFALSSGLGIPFAFDQTLTMILLLVVAPLLEELIFRMALWETLESLLKNKWIVLLSTSLLFSLGHFLAYGTVPDIFRAFIIYQSLYCFFLALLAGWRRKITGSVSSAILIHFGFNFGFYVASFF